MRDTDRQHAQEVGDDDADVQHAHAVVSPLTCTPGEGRILVDASFFINKLSFIPEMNER